MVFFPAPDKCIWLPVGSVNTCARNCYGDYCAKHSSQIRNNPNAGPKPCVVCHKGVKGPYPICGPCGGANYRAMVAYYTKRSPKYYERNHSPPTVEEFLLARNSKISSLETGKCETFSTKDF